MKTISSWLVPVSLTLCAALVIGALTWITRGTIAAERERAQADARADIQERTRLALWRMDSLGAAFLLDESRYPDVDSRLPVKLRFTLSPKGELQTTHASQETKDGMLRSTIGSGTKALDCVSTITMTPVAPAPPPAESKELSKSEDFRKGQRANYDRLDIQSQEAANWGEQNVRNRAVQSYLDNGMAANAPRSRAANQAAPSPAPAASLPAAPTPATSLAANAEIRFAGSESTQSLAKRRETSPRDEAVRDELATERQTDSSVADASPMQASPDLPITAEQQADFVSDTVSGQPRVAWVNGLLLLARRISGPGTHSVFDGAWIDQDALSALLLGEAHDLFSNASLVPAEKPGTDGMVLASFPFRLHVPTPAPVSVPLRESTIISLAMSWTAALIALLATTWLVRGVMRLSERRASFVSAVTHELRTPLTTFRLYSDMLESGAVKEERRSEYLRVLSREADRLTHLVENVLAFSRIERGNARSKVRDADADEMIDHFRERLEARLEASGLHLALDIPPGLRVRADQAAVEHILFNLIDNAAKYAATSDPPVVTISAGRKRNAICLRIRDHGPGIHQAEARRIFRPFHKSAHEAAETKPGVGLGLALSRRLAQEQGGELTCSATESGACFELRLPAATAS